MFTLEPDNPNEADSITLAEVGNLNIKVIGNIHEKFSSVSKEINARNRKKRN